MTAAELRRRIKAYQRCYKLATLTEAVEQCARELECSAGALWHWMAGERKIRPMVAKAIGAVTPRRMYRNT